MPSESALKLAYLEELIGGIPSAAGVWSYITRRVTNLDDARAAFVDNLAETETTGNITHANGVAEQDSLIVTPAELSEYSILYMDLDTLTQNTILRTYAQIDGTNYRLVDYSTFPTDYPTNAKAVLIEPHSLSVAWKITMQSVIAEGVDRTIPYRYIRRSLA